MVDRDISAISDLDMEGGATLIEADLETGSPPPFSGNRFEGVLVTNYLHRPLFRALVEAVAPGGILIYETFAVGNEVFGRPKNPDFLLRHGELLNVTLPELQVVAYEDLIIDEPGPASIQRIAARRATVPVYGQN